MRTADTAAERLWSRNPWSLAQDFEFPYKLRVFDHTGACVWSMHPIVVAPPHKADEYQVNVDQRAKILKIIDAVNDYAGLVAEAPFMQSHNLPYRPRVIEDPNFQTVLVYGIRYSLDLFREFAFAKPGTVLRIVQRGGETLSVEKLEPRPITTDAGESA